MNEMFLLCSLTRYTCVFSYLTASQYVPLNTVLVYWTGQDIQRKDTEPSARIYRQVYTDA